jgi:3-oxoacyl-[acyl-carrier protein] reductase
VASADKANALVAELQTSGIRAAAFKADQADTAQVEGLVKAVTDHFGRLDILVNNAGVFIGGAVDNAGADLAALDRLYAVNLFSVVTAIRAAARVMGEGGRVRTESRNRLDVCFLNLVKRT